MRRDRGRAIGPYARAVERAFARAAGGPRVLSPKEWELVEQWHARGVPLTVVLSALRETGRRVRGSARGLGYFAPAIEEVWASVREGRTAGPAATAAPLPPPEDGLAAWRNVADDESAPRELRAVLRELLERIVAGLSFDEADRALDEALEAVAPGPALESARRESERALEPFRGRMSDEALRATRRRAERDRLRRALALPRLALHR